ncbi:hypothetical protein [Asanoa iriomotensis]|uniref:Uncharacterized protein n=1 Tax=Asanoa iriomotensis TaxID=234613 RepID=A0ABQ4BWI9_9ACTN|nr:hypothetical protein [Asanoa iriomotensis]GIF54908.1 hypothetical protein Air01nite_10030 [Asanoa iriomotensis]
MATVRQPAQSLEILVVPREPTGVLITVSGNLDALNVDYLTGRIRELLSSMDLASIFPAPEYRLASEPGS